jgi:hypothetical protein
MKKIFLILLIVILLSKNSFAQKFDFEHLGGLYIYAGNKSANSLGHPEFLITDPLGRQSGFDVSKGMEVEGIPRAVYYYERIDDDETGEPGNESAILESYTPAEGLYKMSVLGTVSGGYFLNILVSDINLNRNRQDLYGTTYPGKIDNYEMTYSLTDASKFQITYVGSSEIPVFDGKGQRPTDVNKFLQYFNPQQTRTELPAATNTFNLSIIYGNTTTRETFNADLNGNNITSQFDPLPGKHEIVKIPLNQGSSTLVLSIKGTRDDGRVGEDTDRLTFIVP